MKIIAVVNNKGSAFARRRGRFTPGLPAPWKGKTISDPALLFEN